MAHDDLHSPDRADAESATTDAYDFDVELPQSLAGAVAIPAERLLPGGEQLGALFEDLHPRMVAVAVRITHDADAARDVVQNAFEKVLRHGSSFRGQSRVSTWVHRIVANEALMWLRTERRRREVQSDDDDTHMPDDSPGAAHELLVRERQRQLRQGLARLCAQDREVLERCGLADWSYAQYGARRGMHVAAVKSRAFRARRRLGELLRDAE